MRGAVLVLVFLCWEPCLAQVANATQAQDSGSQLESLMQFRQQVNDQLVQLGAALPVQSLLQSVRQSVDNQTESFFHNGMEFKRHITDWVSEHGDAYRQCFSRSAIPESQRAELKETIRSRFTDESTRQAVADVGAKLADRIPVINFISQQMDERPDWALALLNSAEKSTFGKWWLDKFDQWSHTLQPDSADPHGTQTLLQTGGSALSNTMTDSAGSLVQTSHSANPSSLMDEDKGESASEVSGSSFDASQAPFSLMQPLSTVGVSAMGILGPSASSVTQQAYSVSSLGGFLSNIGSQTLNSLGAATSGPLNSMGSSAYLLPTESSLLEISSRTMLRGEGSGSSTQPGGPSASLYSSGLGGGEGGSATSLSSLISSQSSMGSGSSDSSGGNGADNGAENTNEGLSSFITASTGGNAGCCGGLLVVVIMLGLGCAAEYYIKFMHLWNKDHYEAWLGETIKAQTEQLREYLAHHPQRLQEIELEMLNADDASSNPDSPDRLFQLPLDFRVLISNLEPLEDYDLKANEARKALHDERTREAAKRAKQRSGGMSADEPDDVVVEGGQPDGMSDEQPQEEQKKGMLKDMGQQFDDIAPKILGSFYVGYTALPAMVSKHFGFYLTTIIMAILFSSAL